MVISNETGLKENLAELLDHKVVQLKKGEAGKQYYTMTYSRHILDKLQNKQLETLNTTTQYNEDLLLDYSVFCVHSFFLIDSSESFDLSRSSYCLITQRRPTPLYLSLIHI
eukprot:TRINITY_DN1197_c0_g2_i2.p2 TRINITY_DN1197_c0_g2~~TRINITY_DN1197_c0_g2_i2.p2  ORF type:complete len:111 (-),score=9.49 TRINITY_DN1197_c0_g2_i2:61-393(-)